MPRKPVDQLNAGRRFYASLLPDLDVTHFGALWHLFTVGHLVEADLDGIAREIGCSFADLDFLGTLAIDECKAMRATDLASTLYVSNAVISTRIARLRKEGLIERQRSGKDKRAFYLRLTDKGRAMVEHALRRVAQEAKIVRFFRLLAPDDQQALGADLPERSKLMFSMMGANRDPSIFPDPDLFKMDRPLNQVKRHLSFGYGVHFCLGAPVARLEAVTGLRKLVERLPHLRLLGNPQRIDSWIYWGQRDLPVAWD